MDLTIVFKGSKPFGVFADPDAAAEVADAIGPTGTVLSGVTFFPEGDRPVVTPVYCMEVCYQGSSVWIEDDFIEQGAVVQGKEVITASVTPGVNNERQILVAPGEKATVLIKGTDTLGVSRTARRLVNDGSKGQYASLESLVGGVFATLPGE